MSDFDNRLFDLIEKLYITGCPMKDIIEIIKILLQEYRGKK